MAAGRVRATIVFMATFLLQHSHEPGECPSSYAAWRGIASRLRGRPAWAGCIHDDHRVFLVVDADGAEAALALLPEFVAARTVVTPVRTVRIP